MNKKILFSLILIFICLFSCSSCLAVSYKDISNMNFTINGSTYNFLDYTLQYISNNNISFNNLNYYIAFDNTSNVGNTYYGIVLSDVQNSHSGYSTTVEYKEFIKNSYFFGYSSSTGFFFLNKGLGYDDVDNSHDYVLDSLKVLSNVYANTLRSDLNVVSNDVLASLVENDGLPPEQPTVEISKTEYTEEDSTVALYVYPNDFDITDYGFVLYTSDDVEDYVPVVQYFSPGTQSGFDYYYISGEERYEINLNDFFDFKFSDDLNYQVGIYQYNSSGDNLPYALTDTFKIKFGDSYVVNPGGSFDITPKINVSTTESTTSVVVSITSDVPDSYIYYKIDDSSWHSYSEPLNIDYNCTIYAHCWISGGSSGYSSLVINNIITESEFVDSRPIIRDSDFNIYKNVTSIFNNNSSYQIEWFVRASNVDYIWFFSIDGLNWFKFKEISDYNGGVLLQSYIYNLEVKSYPVILNFKYFDPITGLYSDVLSKTITEMHFDSPGVITPSYDENNKYNPDDVIDFNDKDYIGSVNNGLDFSSSENLVESAKDSMESTWGLFATFFSLINGIWIFIPNEIMYLIVSLIIIKFIIAVIGFIRG